MTDNFLVIDQPSALVDFCDRIKAAPWLAVDTEFEREKTYYPEICLLQVATRDLAAVIDPIAISDLGPILDLIYDPGIIKVFHSARQDLEIFYNMKGSVPAPLFDTQVAAPLLGHPEQAGYATLVKAFEGVELSKSHTRTDWKRRPLKPGQLRYAVDDVIYLARIYEKIIDKLTQMNRLNWLDKDFKAMTDPSIYAPETDQVWIRIRSANRLKGKKLSVLQALAKWREETARLDNCPRNWLMRDDAIIDIANQLPEQKRDLFAIKGLHDRVASQYGSALLQIIADAQHLEPQPLPNYIRRKPMTLDQEMLMDLMMVIIRKRAQENDLNAALLAPHKELECLVKNENSLLLTGWRERMIGEELIALLNGEISIHVRNRQVQLMSND